MFTFPILITVNLTVKQNVKHIVRIDNVIRIHILMYSLIVIGHDAYVRNGTPSERTILLQYDSLTYCFSSVNLNLD